MNVLIATSEAVPFAKTGGLADVSGALPVELARIGVRPIVMMPAYREALEAGQPIEPVGVRLEIPIGGKLVTGELLESRLPESDVPVYLVRQDDYFDRSGLYGAEGQDYQDNCERYVFFCRAVLETIEQMGWSIDVVHANDWQTGLLPAYLATEYGQRPVFEGIATLFTVHNLAYQGSFWHWDMALTGLDWKYFNWRQMEFFGNLNLMKTGLVFADAINTVSPRYAEEIQSAPLGCGLEDVLRFRSAQLSGIINGVDYQVWNPATDDALAANYDVETFPQGKAVCKAALQREVGLPEEPDAPLIGIVGRFAEQKGFDLVSVVLQDWLQSAQVQWVILGTGEEKYEKMFRQLADAHPQKFALQNLFSGPLARRIEAGADLFLMPSRYEPCGLNQLYSLRYGTVPVVRETGGLADTITDTRSETIRDGTANGFRFTEFHAQALSETLWRAVKAYQDRPVWEQLIRTGMSQDWSWGQSALLYQELYQQIHQQTCSKAGTSHA